MVQGKFKKAKLQANIQKKQKQKNADFTRRSNAPIQAKSKFYDNQKIKQAISKTLNKSVESEMRSCAIKRHISLSKAQEPVAKHNGTTFNI